MKWAKRLTEDPSRSLKKENPDDRVCFRFVTDEELKRDFHSWVHYKFPPGYCLTARAKKDYEIFCGGFLLFYDDIVRNAVVDHALYFEWERREEDNPDGGKPIVYESVRMLLSPAPQHKNPHRYPSVRTMNQSPAIQEMAVYPQGDNFGDSIDPPPPPPPPPPSMDELDSN